MPDEDYLSNARVAILGLGLMGGSLALALRGKVATLLGVDPDPQIRALALRGGVVDRVSGRAGSLLPQANLIILAAPARAILKLLDDLPRLHPGPAAVIDLGSTKVQIVKAMEMLPERFDTLGGHPMCGKERGSLANAESGLYQGAPFVFVPLARTSDALRRLAAQLASALGALPLWLDAETHDRWVASTSHLPYLIANSLSALTPLEASPLVGPGFRSTSRLSPGSLEMMVDILMTNRLNILADLRSYQEHLAVIENYLAQANEAGLRQVLNLGAQNYHKLIGSPAGDSQR
jgi:prephenate dehydrogenase